MSCVPIAHKCSINRTFQAQLILHRLGVTVHMGVGLTHPVQIYMVVRKWEK